MRSFLLHCYPASWRARYGAEFVDLLEERALRPSDIADIILGAVDARLRARRSGGETPDRGRTWTPARVGGIAAIIGAPVWTVGFMLANQEPTTVDLGIAAGILVTGSLAMVVAILGLSAVQARVDPVLAWIACALPAVGASAVAVGAAVVAVGGTPPEALFLGLLLFIAGSWLFALVAFRTATLSRGAAVLLAVAPVAVIAGGDGDHSGDVLIVSGFIAFAMAWVALGIVAILRDRQATPAAIA